ncbi:hypothetical protein ASC94_00165 [Massilia sp. Root418]|uniref:CD-NTase-associated endodeoxyribonuclease Cap4 n=1 Tax=Massilia sp. Root418 TaxID=1736532 RepID=UPI0006F22A37|nr:dsDNA nuclease domain-containing protein [Massilia sp. Root418]KQX01108.1 hypothetical protein ASC94_00165 [Massilia sp. Root418]
MTASLLEKESTGGANARVGFEYQDAYVLEKLPRWLAQNAFSHVVSEAIGDMEVCYFNPDGGIVRVMYEAKNYALSVGDFWKEISRFKVAHETSPREFPRFAMVCVGYNSNTNPLISKIERLRGVGSSYEKDSPVLAIGRKELVEWASNNGHSADLAGFALDRVDFISYASESADQAFIGELEKNFPELDLSVRQAARLRDVYKGQIARSSSRPVYRKELESAICDLSIAERNNWLSKPVRIHAVARAIEYYELGMDVSSFNGNERASKSSEEWRSLLLAAHNIAEFIKTSTLRRCVEFDGKQRMSTAGVLGFAFSATLGFDLTLEHNGNSYRTTTHSRSTGPFFIESVLPGNSSTSEGIACIGFPTVVGADISMGDTGVTAELPRLSLESARAISNIEDLNLAVAESKDALVRFRSQNRISKLYVFIKAPSIFPFALGHRLNGVCAVQLNDWVDSQYIPTALLPS